MFHIGPIDPLKWFSSAPATSGSSAAQSINSASSSSFDQMVQDLFAADDTDGNGVLTPQELPGLSKSALSQLDTNGDGVLSPAEVLAALQKNRAEVQQALSNATTPLSIQQALAAAQTTPEGQLLQVMKSGSLNAHHHHHGHRLAGASAVGPYSTASMLGVNGTAGSAVAPAGLDLSA